jgi:hypothetical protein
LEVVKGLFSLNQQAKTSPDSIEGKDFIRDEADTFCKRIFSGEFWLCERGNALRLYRIGCRKSGDLSTCQIIGSEGYL